MSQFTVGYTQGVFDMFHIGHLNLLNNAKRYCDYLVVGVNSDELVQKYKKKRPVVEENSRREIVANIKVVDEAIIVDTLDKDEIYEKMHFDMIFVGDDWKGNERWQKTEASLGTKGVRVIFLPYTQSVSSTMLRTEIGRKISDNKEA